MVGFGESGSVHGLTFRIAELELEDIPVPLKGVDISCKVKDFAAEVTINQRFVNVEDAPIEAVYNFPVEEEAAILSFKADVEGKIIESVIKDRDEAREEYEKETKGNRNTAILLEETKKDIFEMRLGQLKPGACANIEIKYMSELPIVEDDKICLTVPTAIGPRFAPSGDQSESGNKIRSFKYARESPAPMTFKVEGEFRKGIEKVTSPSHDFWAVVAKDEEKVKVRASIEAPHDLDRDVVVYFEHDDEDMPNKPSVFVEKDSESTVAMLSLVPYFQLAETKVEMIFLIDRSGSMGGQSIKKAKEALILFLHALPTDSYFNVVSFGSTFESLYEKGSRPYSAGTLEEAKKHVRKMDANFGGTEIYAPLDHIFKTPCSVKDRERQIIVLTDGQVSNTEQVVNLVKKNSANSRLFALGIGSSASRFLVKGIARAGNGISNFAKDEEDLRPKVAALMKNSLQPAFSNVRIRWKTSEGSHHGSEAVRAKPAEVVTDKPSLLGFKKPKKAKKNDGAAADADSSEKSVIGCFSGQVPSRTPPVYDGNRLLVYHVFGGDVQVQGVKVIADSPQGPLEVELEVGGASTLGILHKLAARKKIQELEEEEDPYSGNGQNRERIRSIALKYSLTSKCTSFFGVNKNTRKTQWDGAMTRREITNQIPIGFQMHADVFCKLMAKQCSANYSSFTAIGLVEKLCRGGKDCSVETDGGTDDKTDGGGPEHIREQEETVGDLLQELISQQKFDGSFVWASCFETAGLGKDVVASAKPKGTSMEVWLSAIALKILEIKLKDQKESWSLIAKKILRFIESKMKTVGDLMGEAEKIVSSTE